MYALVKNPYHCHQKKKQCQEKTGEGGQTKEGALACVSLMEKEEEEKGISGAGFTKLWKVFIGKTEEEIDLVRFKWLENTTINYRCFFRQTFRG